MPVVAAAAVGAILILLLILSPRLQSSGAGRCSPAGVVAPGGNVDVLIPAGAASSANATGYTPKSIVVVIGVNNTIVWTNSDRAYHTVSSSSAPECGDFDSSIVYPGGAWSHTFTVPGTYSYYCKYHPWMKGTVVVEAGLADGAR
jgi:plastocyanin